MKVYFEGNFWGHRPHERAGKRVELNHSFEWDGYTWLLPAAYLCSKGLVLDFCKQIPLTRMQSFLSRGEEKATKNQLTAEESELLGFDNPLNESIHFKAAINNRIVEGFGMCSVSWYPCRLEMEQENKEVSVLMEEYHCDKEYVWQFTRASIPWPYKKRPSRVSLTLDLIPYTIPYPCGQHFTFHMGDKNRQLQIIHPISKKEYILNMNGMKSDLLPENAFRQLGPYEYPRSFVRLSFHHDIAPEHPEFVIKDCVRSDQPRLTPGQEEGRYSRPNRAASVGIIGGIYATFTPEQAKEKGIKEQNAVSSMHFEPIQQVEWRISALITRGEAITLELPLIS